MTTTPSSNHISDFRKQRRTDSRADKPDRFPGFDLNEDSTTPSLRKRRRQAYTKLIHLFLQNTKNRLETIRDVIKDESEVHFRLTRPPAGEQFIGDSMENNDEIRYSDEENRQFIDFAFADAIGEQETNAKIQNENRENAAQTYLNSLFEAVGYRRITTTTPNPNDNGEGNIVARYLINPLLSAWNSTRDRFNLYNENNDNDDNNNSDIDGSVNNAQTTIFRVNFFDNRDNIKPKMHTNSVSNMNKEPNENRVDNFNYSLPLIQLMTNNVTNVMLTNETTTMTTTTTTTSLEVNANKVNVSQNMLDVEYIGDDHVMKKPRNTVTTNAEDAATAFQNAFLKYSNYMQHPMEYAKFNINTKLTKDNSNEMKSDKLLNGNDIFVGNLFDTNSSHIQVVPGKKLKANESLDENVTIVASNSIDIDGGIESNGKSFSENVGILVLEIFGTVIGMTWRAISEIPNYFNSQNQNDDA